MTNAEVASLLKKRRLELHLKLEDVGNALGVHKSTISRWESGDVNSIKSGHLYLLAKVLYLPVETLLGFNTDKKIESAETILLRKKIESEVEKIHDKDVLEQVLRIVKTFIKE